jgi:hypothetical protein
MKAVWRTGLAAAAVLAATTFAVQAGRPTSRPSPNPHATGATARVTGPKTTKTAGPVRTSTGASATTRPTMKGGNAATARASAPGQTRETAKAESRTPTTPATASLAPAALPKNPKLVARLQAMLPPGMTAEQAAFGFRNQGQFVAAVHVSNNLGIPFNELRSKMVTEGKSLGQSIQALKPHADSDAEAERAVGQAEAELDQD